jgi:hypothetical protein
MSACEKMRLGGSGFALLVASALALFTAAVAPAEEHTLFVPSTAFLPANHGVAFYRHTGGLGELCLGRGWGYFTATLDLPAGAKLTAIRGDFEDESDSAFGTLALFRLGNNGVELLAVTSMSLAKPRSGTVEASLDTEETVREPFRYVLHLTLTGPGVCLRSAEVAWHP